MITDEEFLELQKRVDELEKIVSKLTKKRNSASKDGDVEKLKEYKEIFRKEKLNTDGSNWELMDFVFWYSYYHNKKFTKFADQILIEKELWQRCGKIKLVLEYFDEYAKTHNSSDENYAKKITKWYIKYCIDKVEYQGKVIPFYVMCSNWALNEYNGKLDEYIRLEKM